MSSGDVELARPGLEDAVRLNFTVVQRRHVCSISFRDDSAAVFFIFEFVDAAI